MGLLEKIYGHIKTKYYQTDGPLGIAITLSFFTVVLAFIVVAIIDNVLLDHEILALYERTFKSNFTFRFLLIPITIVTAYFTYRFKKFDSKNL